MSRSLAASPGGGFAGAVLVAALALAACDNSAPEPEPEQTAVPQELQAQPAPPPPEGSSLGTPLAERVATLGLLNKRNNLTQDVEIKPGESKRVGDVVLRLASCERTAPWEDPPETGAFVQVFVRDRPDADSEAQWTRVFSGWLFKNSPGLNVVEHPVYDVWVKDCAMSFPDEEAPLERPAPGGNGAPSAPPAADPSPAPAASPPPATEA